MTLETTSALLIRKVFFRVRRLLGATDPTIGLPRGTGTAFLRAQRVQFVAS